MTTERYLRHPRAVVLTIVYDGDLTPDILNCQNDVWWAGERVKTARFASPEEEAVAEITGVRRPEDADFDWAGWIADPTRGEPPDFVPENATALIIMALDEATAQRDMYRDALDELSRVVAKLREAQ